jgi:hypothetical protein
VPIPIEALEDELLNLPPSTRALLARRLIASLDTPEAAENERFWFDEAERRWEGIAAGRAECIPADEALREAREMLKRRP